MGFVDFCRQCLAWDGDIGPLLQDTQGKTHRICNIAAILKMTDSDHGDWVLPLNGFRNGDREIKNCDRPARLSLYAVVYSDLCL